MSPSLAEAYLFGCVYRLDAVAAENETSRSVRASGGHDPPEPALDFNSEARPLQRAAGLHMRVWLCQDSSVRSTVSEAAFVFTDSMPFRALALVL